MGLMESGWRPGEYYVATHGLTAGLITLKKNPNQ